MEKLKTRFELKLQNWSGNGQLKLKNSEHVWQS